MASPEHFDRSVAMKAAWVRVRAGEGFIYLAEVGCSIKIGFSLDPAKRCKTMKGRLLATIPGTIEDEKALHESLQSARVMGEVYRLDVIEHPALPAGLKTRPEEQDPDCDLLLLRVGIRAPKTKRVGQQTKANKAKNSERFRKYQRWQKTAKGIASAQKLVPVYLAHGWTYRS